MHIGQIIGQAAAGSAGAVPIPLSSSVKPLREDYNYRRYKFKSNLNLTKMKPGLGAFYVSKQNRSSLQLAEAKTTLHGQMYTTETTCPLCVSIVSVSLIHILIFHLLTTLHKPDPHCHHHHCHHQLLLLFFTLDLKHICS